MEGIYVLIASVLPLTAVYKLLCLKVGAEKTLDFVVKAKSADFMELESPTRTVLIDTSHFRDKDGNLVLKGQEFGVSKDGKILLTAKEAVLEGLVDELDAITYRMYEQSYEPQEDIWELENLRDAMLWEMKRRRETPGREVRVAKL